MCIIFPRCLGIIREEELIRIDHLVKEDGWVQDDEIDYNQKLVFSDDDSDTPPQTSKSKEKRVNFNDREKEMKMMQRKEEMERAGRFKITIIISMFHPYVNNVKKYI